MEAIDLRIGNLVRIDSCKDQPELNGKEVVIKSITTFFQLKERKGKDYYTRVQDKEGRVHSVFIYYIKPIEITEEYLQKFGFKIHEGHQFAINKIWYCPLNMLCYHDNRIGCDLINTTRIQYVHELQNYYKAVVKEEIKLS